MSRNFCLMVLVGLIFPGPALALVGDSMGGAGLDGSLRTITAATYNYPYSFPNPISGAPIKLFPERSDGFSQSILRLIFGGEPTDWLKYEVHGVEDLNMTTSGSLFGGELLGGYSMTRYRITDASWQWGDEPHVKSMLLLDRLNLKFSLPWADVTIGRQAVTFGKAYFWNPLDVFLAFDPRTFDRDYKPGVDALRIDVPVGEVSGFTLVGVAGRSDAGQDFGASWRGSALIGRGYTNLWDWDVAVQGGKVFGAYQLGAALSGELGSFDVRAEGAYFWAMEADAIPDHFDGVLGLGYRFDFDLLVEAEYFYNGAGDTDNWDTSLQRLSSGRTLHMGNHLSGLMLDYEILPILHGTLAWIFSISDLSSLLQPGLSLSISDEADFLFGAMIALGARPANEAIDYNNSMGLKSEFGTYPNFYYMEFKFYF